MQFNAWIKKEIDTYHFQLTDSTVEFHIAEKNLNKQGAVPSVIIEFYKAAEQLSKIAQKFGDDKSYLQALRKIYTRMMVIYDDDSNSYEARTISKKYARIALTHICKLYDCYEINEKAAILRRDFVKRCS